MIDNLFNILYDAMYQNHLIAISASFVWGILSIILSPCHLSSIPLIIGYLSSQGELKAKRAISLSFVFSLGILVTIAIIGAITYSLGRIMGDVGTIGNYIVASMFIIIGLYLLDLIKLPWDGAKLRSTKQRGLFSAFILGLLFGIGLGPCTFAFMAPVLGVVFEVSQTNSTLALSLITAFAIGHCLVIVFAGSLISTVQKLLNWNDKSKGLIILKKICGILVILGGIYFIYITI
jgi:cytochrome c-type biogenesis protein